MFFPFREKKHQIKENKKDKKHFPGYIESVAETLRSEGSGTITSDVSGSYTGMTIDNEIPVQDADDL